MKDDSLGQGESAVGAQTDDVDCYHFCSTARHHHYMHVYMLIMTLVTCTFETLTARTSTCLRTYSAARTSVCSTSRR